MAQYATTSEALTAILAQNLTMAEALAAMAREIERLNPAVGRANVALIERLRGAGVGGGAPAVGDILPGFALPDENGQLRTLDEFTRRGPVVVSMLRGHWCPFCYIETRNLAKAAPDIGRAGGSAVVILPETQTYARTVGARAASLPVLSDVGGAYALELGLNFYIGDELKELFDRIGTRLPVFQGQDAWFLPLPATFVIDRDGRVVDRLVDPDFRLRRLALDRVMTALAKAVAHAS